MPPRPRFSPDGRKAKNPVKTLTRLLSYLKKHLFILLLVMLCIFLGAYASVILRHPIHR